MNKTQSQKMGEMPIPKLLFSMSAPAILSMLVQSLYNIVDSIFVARINENALTAISLAFPMQMITMAFAFGISIGSSSIISRELGEGANEEAGFTAKNGMFLSLVVSLFFAIFGYFISRGFISIFADKGTEVYTYSVQYLSICMIMSFGMFFEIFANKVMQATGNMVIPMVTQLIGAITNIVLDPILIFGLLGFKAMGVKGAAIATVTGQIIAMIFAMINLFKHKTDINLNLSGFKPEKKYISDIIKIGIPVMVMNSVASLATTAMNAILIVFSTTAVAVLGVYFKLQSFVFMPVFGLNQGSMPILGYNYGANKRKRFDSALKLALSVAVVIMTFGLLLFQLIPQYMLKLFNASDDMLMIGSRALKIISLSFIPAAFGITIINMFQAIGHGFKSMVMSLMRQIIFLLPIAFILSKFSTLDYVWYAYPIAEIFTVLIFIPIAIKTINNAFIKHKSITDILPVEPLTETEFIEK